MKTHINEPHFYDIISEADENNFIWGNYTTYHLQFINGENGNVYKIKSANNYFFIDDESGKIYCESFEAAVRKLYEAC